MKYMFLSLRVSILKYFINIEFNYLHVFYFDYISFIRVEVLVCLFSFLVALLHVIGNIYFNGFRQNWMSFNFISSLLIKNELIIFFLF